MTRILLAVVVTALVALNASAQEALLRGLHVRGYVGFSFDRNMAEFSSSQDLAQEISTDLQGAVIHPDFVSFGTSFTYAHSTAALNGTGVTGSSTYAGSASVLLLPASSYPLAITYQRTRVGVGPEGFTTTVNMDRLGLDWRLNLAGVPKIAVMYHKNASWSDVPVATLAAAESHGSGLSLSASDSYKGWDWDLSWMRSSSETGAQLLDAATEFDQSYSTLAANVQKAYWGDRGKFAYNFARTASETATDSLNQLTGVQTAHGASTIVRFNPKLTASGSFQYYAYTSEGRVADPSDTTQFTIVTHPASGYIGSGNVAYQLHPRISIGDAMSYSAASLPESSQELTSKYFSNTPTVNANYTWHGIRLTGSYALGYLRTGTNRERVYDSYSHGGSVNASWVHPWVALSGGFGVGHGTFGVVPGSYTDTTYYSFSAESSKLRWIGNLRFRWNLMDRTLLGTTGFLQSHRSTWSVALQRKRWQIEGGASGGSGARQAFGETPLAYEPLPPLIGVLLVDDTSHNYFLSGSGLLRRNLRVHGTFRKDVNEIRAAGGTAHYSLVEVYADYRIGKMIINASYGHYLSASDTITSNWGSSTNRFRFRIVRTFDLF